MTQNDFTAKQTNIFQKQVAATLKLLSEGATIPFIARYRKEMTGNLDEVQIGQIRDAAALFEQIEQRKQTILNALHELDPKPEAVIEKVASCFDLTDLEDLYLPYKKRRKTKADVARELGLEPLAKQIMTQRGMDVEHLAGRYLSKQVVSIEEALSGARDIIAEWVNENVYIRQRLRQLFHRSAVIKSTLVKGKEAEAQVYEAYFDHNEKLAFCPSHRLLAILRGSHAGLLRVSALPDREKALELIERVLVKSADSDGKEVQKAIKEAYSRLLAPSLENDILGFYKEKADEKAIEVFAKNLKNLLLAPPLGSKRILAIDPGFRTGCKVVCLDEQGNLLHNETIYPHSPQNEKSKASSKILQLVQAYKIDAIAIGDGTAGRETETWIKHTRFNADVEVFVVREDGASIYSASPVARKEFPNFDVTVRGAVSIGRRLMDPLSELVKIDPKSLGVGQYQHDVDQKKLKQALDDVVLETVNRVGVEVNSASPYLLQYVSGLSLNLAEKLVAFRSEQGSFKSREELKKVPGVGPKAFEQAAGFLRIENASNPLDTTAVHPESYGKVKQFAKSLNLQVEELIRNPLAISQLRSVEGLSLDDIEILKELEKPARDPRSQAAQFNFSDKIKRINDLEIGMRIAGLVTNVTNFGAFVNIGIKENGLIHKSQLSDAYVENPEEFIRLGEQVEVQVLQVEVDKKRIGLKLLGR